MKKIFPVLICVIAIISCGKKKPITETPKKDTSQTIVKIDSLVFEVDTFHVIEIEKDCPKDDCTSCDLYYERIKTCLKPVHDSVNMYIDTLILKALSEIGEAELKYDLKKIAQSFIASKREMEANNGEVGGVWNWDLHSSIYRPCEEIITVTTSWGGYTGGAHGNGYSETACFFTSNGKRITMADMFNDIEAVNKIGLKYFKEGAGIDPGKDISEDGWDMDDESFTLNENFDITSESITWEYRTYEIGPYSAVPPTITIPIKELEKYMKVKFTDVVIQ